ncbi:a92146cc-d99e-499b-8b75-7953b6838ff7 [Sclerotinia trifoliorum]|uniref:A92146cc-d99e-499b-8b75-7953b6838ff7 n=1 Tax=Sclerotinia trifoliorum TaxID=28548 RepID=A0A8H2ZN14_9HELO|nr:a92146cc-d99e-499b-8b75-7953b6838ff7 [Sclerotinia trifoliorum]
MLWAANTRMATFLLLSLFCPFLPFVLALPGNSVSPLLNSSSKLILPIQAVAASASRIYTNTIQGKLSARDMVQIALLCSVFPGFWYLRNGRRSKTSNDSKSLKGSAHGTTPERSLDINESEVVDPGLLKKHSKIRSYTTSRFTYSSLRIFFSRHAQADKLPTKPAPLPLLVFIHGLGGSVAQFNPLLTSLVNLASCLSIDLPGCGLSEFDPKLSWDAYTVDALAELLGKVIGDYREKDTNQGVILIGHSLGCSISALLASTTSPRSIALSENVIGLIAICPRAEPPSEDEVSKFRKLLLVPNLVFDLWRNWDRRGGTESASVHRFVGPSADEETKKLQERFNSQSKTAVWRRMAAGTLPVYENHIPIGGLPGRDVWKGLDMPVFLVAGAVDNITKPEEIEKIAQYLGKSHPSQIELNDKSEPIVDAAAPVDISRQTKPISNSISPLTEKQLLENNNSVATDSLEDPSTPDDFERIESIPSEHFRPKRVLKTTIIPAPASHALLYMPFTVRILAGLISDFLCTQVTPRLSLGWQLQFLSTSGKWDVKNLAKWQAVAPVSEPIAGVFRAMKTLREVDDTHCPEVFVSDWGEHIKDIVDISHESPVYDPRGLEKGGIRYHKFPTVSKIPPTSDEVVTFINLIDRLRDEQEARKKNEGVDGEWFVGVHCHYGFNRTGYFIVCYLVERCGYGVQEAIDEFAKRRPKGIKHAHFMDRLFVRYCVGLKRAPTL